MSFLDFLDDKELFKSKYQTEDNPFESSDRLPFNYSNNDDEEAWFKDRLGRITASCYDQIGFKEKKAGGNSKADILSFILNHSDSFDLIEQKQNELQKPIEKFTVSELKTIYDCLEGEYEMTKTAYTYMCQKISEIDTGESHHFTAEATDFGSEHEPIALQRYADWLKINYPELEFDAKGKDFVVSTSHDMLGGSPDGLAWNKNGIVERVIECKCPHNSTNHTKNLLSEKVDERYDLQTIGHLINTGAAYVDFVSFNPRSCPSMQLSIVTVKRSDVIDKIEKLETDLNRFLQVYLSVIKDLQAKHSDFEVPEFIQKYL